MQSSSRQCPTTRGGVAQGEHLGVRGGVAGQLAFVVPGGDHHAVAHDDRADRHIAVRRRRGGLGRAPAASPRRRSAVPSQRRGWDSNPRRVAPHTLSKRADSAALAPLPGSARVAVTARLAPPQAQRHPPGEVTVGPCATGVRESGQDREVAAFNGSARVPQAAWPSPHSAGARVVSSAARLGRVARARCGAPSAAATAANPAVGPCPPPVVDRADRHVGLDGGDPSEQQARSSRWSRRVTRQLLGAAQRRQAPVARRRRDRRSIEPNLASTVAALFAPQPARPG